MYNLELKRGGYCTVNHYVKYVSWISTIIFIYMYITCTKICSQGENLLQEKCYVSLYFIKKPVSRGWKYFACYFKTLKSLF